MKKLIKKFKKWLIHKLGAYTKEEIPYKNIAIINKQIGRISLDITIPNEALEMLSEANHYDFVKFEIKESIHNFARKVLPELMSYTIEKRGSNQVVRCLLEVVPPVNGESLADLLAEKESNNEG